MKICCCCCCYKQQNINVTNKFNLFRGFTVICLCFFSLKTIYSWESTAEETLKLVVDFLWPDVYQGKINLKKGGGTKTAVKS